MDIIPAPTDQVLYVKMDNLEKIKLVIKGLSEGKVTLIELDCEVEVRAEIIKTLQDLSTYGKSKFEFVHNNFFMIDPSTK